MHTGCMLMVVDFPAPLWPSSARIWPSNIAMSRLSTATCKLQLCPQQSVSGVSKANSILSILCWKWHFLSLAMYLTPSSCCTSWYFCLSFAYLFPVWWLSWLSESIGNITCAARSRSAFFPAGVWNSRPRPIVRTTHPEAADFRRRAFKGGG